VQLNGLLKWRMARPAVLLALAAFAPLVIYAGFNGYVALSRRQAAMADQSVTTAQSLVENIDRQIASNMEDAQTLAEAPALDPSPRGNVAVFEEVAKRSRQRHNDWMAAVLMTPDGRWVFSTEPDDDAPHRIAEDMPSLRKAVQTGQPVVGDIVKGAHGKTGIPLRAPVVRGGKVVYVLTVVLNPRSLNDALVSLRLPPRWVVAVVNTQDHVVARAPQGGRAIGALINAEAQAARARGGGGTYHGHTLDGAETQSFYWKSPTTSWSAHVAVPRALYEAPLRQMLWYMLTGLSVCLLLALALVVLWIRDFESRRSHASAVEQATRIDALGRLTGGVAHDFNNLLTVIQGNTEILSRRLHAAGQAGSVDAAQAATQAERPLSAIRTATDRAAKLTRQLLVFARGGPAEPMPVDLSRKILDLLGALSQVAGSGVAVDTDLESGLPPVKVDPLQLEAALLNLAANARDAMGGTGAMELRVRRSEAGIVLSVRDHGPGFDPAVLSRVFDPFFTTKLVGQGTGLGLSQVYGLVKGAGGQVEAGNAPGGGGMVTLVFPPLLEEPTAPPVDPLAAAPAPGPLTGHGLASVLLVDDNDAVRATTAAFLRECGLSIIEAPDAAHALLALETAKVEAVVSDIIMPGELDGMSLAQKIKIRWPDLPVLLVSGFSERAAEAQARGFPVVNKPYSLPELERRLRILVARYHAAQA